MRINIYAEQLTQEVEIVTALKETPREKFEQWARSQWPNIDLSVCRDCCATFHYSRETAQNLFNAFIAGEEFALSRSAAPEGIEMAIKKLRDSYYDRVADASRSRTEEFEPEWALMLCHICEDLDAILLAHPTSKSGRVEEQ